MNAINRLKIFINSQEFLIYLIALVLSTLMAGYAPSSISLGIFILFSIRYSVIHKTKIEFDIKLLFPIVLYLLFCLSLLWSVQINQSIVGLERTIALFLVPIAFSLIPKFSLKNYNLILEYYTKTNILFGLFFLIVALVRYFTTHLTSVFLYHDLVSIFNFNAIYVSIIFSLSLFYLLSKNNKTKMDKIVIFFFITLLLLLSSKAMMFVLLIGSIVYFLYKRSKWFNKIKLLFISVLSIFIIGISSISLRERILFEKNIKFDEILNKEEFGNIYPWTGGSIRLLQLRILKEQIEEEAIFWKGFGLFASRKDVKKRHLKFNTYKGFHNKNYHNQYAQIFSESGIFGLVLLIIMLAASFLKALNSKNFLFIMFCLTITFVFFTESLLWRQTGLFLFIILYCLLNRTVFENCKTVKS